MGPNKFLNNLSSRVHILFHTPWSFFLEIWSIKILSIFVTPVHFRPLFLDNVSLWCYFSPGCSTILISVFSRVSLFPPVGLLHPLVRSLRPYSPCLWFSILRFALSSQSVSYAPLFRLVTSNYLLLALMSVFLSRVSLPGESFCSRLHSQIHYPLQNSGPSAFVFSIWTIFVLLV